MGILEYEEKTLNILKLFNSQAPDLPCAAVEHVFRLSRLRFGC